MLGQLVDIQWKVASPFMRNFCPLLSLFHSPGILSLPRHHGIPSHSEGHYFKYIHVLI